MTGDAMSEDRTNDDVHSKNDRTPKRLYRTTDEKMLAGVCGGLARYFNLDPTLVRVVVALLTLVTSGSGIIAYIVLMFVMPQQTPELSATGQPAPDPGPPPVFVPEEDVDAERTQWPSDPATLWTNAKRSTGEAEPEQDLR